MALHDPDIVVIGSGPNGLVAGATLAREGFGVLVLEAHPRRPGGAVGTAELTSPGFLHDLGAGFFPLVSRSPAFFDLGLERAGVEWLRAPIDSCHPAEDGSYACLSGKPEVMAEHFGSRRDGATWAKVLRWYRRVEPSLFEALLSPWPTVTPLLGLRPLDWWRLAKVFMRSGRGLAERLFETQAARRVLPGLALHADFSPEDAFSAGLGMMLAGLAVTSGFVVPRGGAQGLTNALLTLLERHGGKLRLGAKVKRIEVRSGRAVAVVLENGESIPAKYAVMADVSAPSLFMQLLPSEQVPWWVARKMRRFPYGFGLLKVDWALGDAVPWKVEQARISAVVHVGDSLRELQQFVADVRQNRWPERPYLVVGQQSLLDPLRAPAMRHTLYAYTHVPVALTRDPSTPRVAFVERIESRIERLAPGFLGSILERHVTWPDDFSAENPNLLNGSHLGGSAHLTQQFCFRPVFPYFRYRMPVKGLYLCSSYTHPGGGVHGMCGYNAARRLLRELI